MEPSDVKYLRNLFERFLQSWDARTDVMPQVTPWWAWMETSFVRITWTHYTPQGISTLTYFLLLVKSLLHARHTEVVQKCCLPTHIFLPHLNFLPSERTTPVHSIVMYLWSWLYWSAYRSHPYYIVHSALSDDAQTSNWLQQCKEWWKWRSMYL